MDGKTSKTNRKIDNGRMRHAMYLCNRNQN